MKKYTMTSTNSELMDAIAEEFGLEIQGSVADRIKFGLISHSYHFETDQDTISEIHVMLIVTDIESANNTEIGISEGWV